MISVKKIPTKREYFISYSNDIYYFIRHSITRLAWPFAIMPVPAGYVSTCIKGGHCVTKGTAAEFSHLPAAGHPDHFRHTAEGKRHYRLEAVVL
ncbi:hypothetical protein DNU24_21405 [Salmonella enterica subsp. salamae]|uniref:Uncharacterized protein n=1 Tax=Salmonella enterica subsp. salamae TaxID=59202 RepID=A0A5Y3XH67_SALER|nr:hypothetical protein [Salmonella enterica subsp. salamae]ECJ4508168.1 hypothetical protein [Salmonella enterica subsp. salamae]